MILLSAEKEKPPFPFFLFKVTLTELQCSEKYLGFLLVGGPLLIFTFWFLN